MCDTELKSTTVLTINFKELKTVEQADRDLVMGFIRELASPNRNIPEFVNSACIWHYHVLSFFDGRDRISQVVKATLNEIFQHTFQHDEKYHAKSCRKSELLAELSKKFTPYGQWSLRSGIWLPWWLEEELKQLHDNNLIFYIDPIIHQLP